MLGVHRVTSARAHYYLSDLAGELPLPAAAGERPAVWIGRAAEGLGLGGEVDPGRLRAVLEGRHPVSGHRLRSARATVLGFDMTFSAPKSVSVLFGLGGDDVARDVVAAHGAGVRGAVAYLETHGLAARRGSGDQRAIVPTTGLVGASFTHGVNRNLDPHLHTHVVMSNMVHGIDGRWSACDHRGISAHRSAASAVYEAHLRSELSKRLGVGWVKGAGLQTEIAGVSPLVIGEFSSRSADIRMRMAERRSHSSRGSRVAWAATRSQKAPGGSYEELSSEWGSRARSLGTGPLSLTSGREQRGPTTGVARIDEHRFGAVLSLTPDGAARRRDIVTAFGTAALGGADAQSLERLADLWTPPISDRVQIGVAEDVRTLRSVVPGPHVLGELGPRPVSPSLHEMWCDAARAIDVYRRRWGVAGGGDALGVAALPSGISSLPTERLVEHLQIARDVELTRHRLGWHSALVQEMDRGR
jgi:conjugative relaxase-like TrwC/TraI family protein